MIELIFTACSLLHGMCREEKLVFAEPGLSVYSCAMRGQIELARWVVNHPNWSVVRYRCGRDKQLVRS
jgi:hypothetical protein